MRAAQKGLKMSCIHPFGHHNCTRIIFGKPWFRPVFEPFVVPNWPIFKARSALRRAKIAQHGWAQNELILLVCAPQIVPLEKHIVDPFLTDFLVAKQPIFKAFCDFGVAKMACNGLKRAHFTCLGTPNGLGSFLEKHICDPLLTHLLSHSCLQNNPFSRHFGILRGPKPATTSSKRAKNTCFGIPCGLGSFLKKVIFCTRCTLLTHFGTHLFGLPLAACRSPLGLGTGV